MTTTEPSGGRPGWVPIPDPTTMTTEQLDREIGHLKSWAQANFDGIEALSKERMVRTEQRLGDLEKLLGQQSASAEKRSDALTTAAENRASALDRAMDDRFNVLTRKTSDLESVLIGLRASLRGQDTGAADVTEASIRNRNLVFAIGGFVLTVLTVVALYIGLRPHTTTTYVPVTPVTTPTTTAPRAG